MRYLISACLCLAFVRVSPAEEPGQTYAADSVVYTVVRIRQGNHGGSGVVVGQGRDHAATVVTAAHVIQPAPVAVRVVRGGREYPASVLVVDRQKDVAILRAGFDGPVDSTRVCDADPPEGSEVCKVGFPGIPQPVLDFGPVLPRRSAGWCAQVVSRPGDSGGGLFDADGYLVSTISGETWSAGEHRCTYGSGPGPIRDCLRRAGCPDCIRGQPQGKPKPAAPAKAPPIVKVQAPAPSLPAPPQPAPSSPGAALAVPDLSPLLSRLDQVLAQQADFQKQLAELKSRPGTPGPPGPAGPPGKDADPAQLAALQAQVDAIARQRLQAVLTDADGNVLQSVEFGPGQPLRLRLVPVKQ